MKELNKIKSNLAFIENETALSLTQLVHEGKLHEIEVLRTHQLLYCTKKLTKSLAMVDKYRSVLHDKDFMPIFDIANELLEQIKTANEMLKEFAQTDEPIEMILGKIMLECLMFQDSLEEQKHCLKDIESDTKST
jgi:hypothetical protein